MALADKIINHPSIPETIQILTLKIPCFRKRLAPHVNRAGNWLTFLVFLFHLYFKISKYKKVC